jgi:undecaprenyl-diphosphatase
MSGTNTLSPHPQQAKSKILNPDETLCVAESRLSYCAHFISGAIPMTLSLLLKTILMGIIEGVTEFLPISSTGHMILAEEWIGLSEDPSFTASFTVFIQSGAILAVIFFFRHELWPLSGTVTARRSKWILWVKMAIAFLPAAITGLLFHTWIEKHLFNPVTVAAALIFYGVLLIFFEHRHKTGPNSPLCHPHEVTFGVAFRIGLFQCLALIPGTSRSTATILGAMMLGLNRPLAAEFSFLLSIPTIAAAAGFQLIQKNITFSSTEWTVLGVGFFTSFCTASGVICWLMKFLRKHSFMAFGWYRIILGLAVLLWRF